MRTAAICCARYTLAAPRFLATLAAAMSKTAACRAPPCKITAPLLLAVLATAIRTAAVSRTLSALVAPGL